MSQQIQSSQEPKPEQAVKTPSPTKKRNWFARIPPRVRTIIAIAVIVVAVVGAFHGPSEGESDNVTGDPAFIPTVGITNMVGSASLNKSVEVQGVRLTVSQVTEATKFSDDRKLAGVYTVRVMMSARNSSSSPIGVQYNALLRLVLPNGQEIVPKYISLLPETLPHQSASGFADFPLAVQVPLSSLTLRFGNEASMSFAK